MLLSDADLKNKMNLEHKELLNIIINSSNFIIDYFNKLLHWSELGSNDLMLSREWINLNKIFNTTKVLYSLRFEEKNQQFEIDCGDEIKIYADIAYFQQLINNLVSNASKFTPENGIIRIQVLRDHLFTFIKIIDSGTGMIEISDEELFGSAFHKSTRGTRGEKGTGLGLKICKKIIDAHHFGISYKSEKNKGTEFEIKISNE